MPYKIVEPVFDIKLRGLCTYPYDGHPNGCPNFNKADRCPPKVKIYNRDDYVGDIYAIWITFPFGEHVDKMKKLHPNWSEKQAKCCLYWQGTARKLRRKQIKQFLIEHPNYEINETPEAMGINVFETMKQIGIEIEKVPTNITTHVAIAFPK